MDLDMIASLPAWFMAVFFTILPFVLLLIFFSLTRLKLIRLEVISKKFHIPEGLLFFFPIIGIWLFLFLWVSEWLPRSGYGWSAGVGSMKKLGDILVVADTIYTAGADGEGTPINRLHLISMESGKEMQRLVIEKYLGIQKNFIIYQNDNTIFCMDTHTGNTTKPLDQNILNTIFPSGIFSYKINENDKLLEVITQDGIKSFYEPCTLKKSQETNEVFNISFKTEFILVGDLRKQIYRNGSQINPALFFLNGNILQISENSEYVFLLSSDTLDSKSLFLNCVSSKGELIWKVDLGEIDRGIEVIKKQIQYNSILHGQLLVLEANGIVLAFETGLGKFRWKIKI